MQIRPTYMEHVYAGLEPLEAFDVVYGGSFEHRLMSPKHALMEHQRFIAGNIRLETGRYEFPVIARGRMPKDGICIGFVAEGAEVTRYNTSAIHTDEVQIYPPGVELLYHAGGASHWINFTASEEHIQTVALARTGRPLELQRRSVYSVRLRPGGRSHLTVLASDALLLARRLQPEGGMTPALAEAVCESLLNGYVDALCTSAPLRKTESILAAQRHHHLIAACEQLVMIGEAAADITLTEIARRSGYTLRSLELIFHRGVGMSPGRWFMTARLNGALRDLLTSDSTATVSSVAHKWGFRHLSRFAAYYQNAFGELPSQTLARSAALH